MLALVGAFMIVVRLPGIGDRDAVKMIIATAFAIAFAFAVQFSAE